MCPLQVTRSTLVALATATVLLAAQVAPSQAAPSPDPLTIAQAYGDLSVFVLDIAAGHDGQARNPAGEQAFRQLFAQQLLLAYPALDPDTQGAVAVLPATRDQLAHTWPQLTREQRRAIAQEMAGRLEPMFVDMPCDRYVALETAELVPSGPYEQANTTHLFACWDANPGLAPVQPSATGGGATRVASPDPNIGQASSDFVPDRGHTLPGMLNFMGGYGTWAV